jgi:hypothetical protein
MYGPNGSDEIRILSIEAEASNTPDYLTMAISGIAPNKSLGDWTKDVSYALIDDASFNTPFKIELTPLVYVVRPDGSMIELNRNNALDDRNFQQKALFPKNKDVIINSGILDGTFCGSYTIPEDNVSILNMGKESIETLIVDFYIGNSVIQSLKINQLITPLSSIVVPTEAQLIADDADINIFISEINGESYPIDQYNLVNSNIIKPLLNTKKLKMRITFDEFPNETQWILRTDSGMELARKTYAFGEVDSYSSLDYEFDIPENSTCLNLTLEDSYGDGWLRWGTLEDGSSTPVPGIEFFNQWDILIKDKQNIESVTSFATDFDAVDIYVSVDALSDTKSIDIEHNLQVYPNPAGSIIRVDLNDLMDIAKTLTIENPFGQLLKVMDLKNSQSGTLELDITDLIPGMYLVSLNTSSGKLVSKFVKI